MDVDEFLDKVLNCANKDWYIKHLKITSNQYNELWEEETLTKLQEMITELYFMTSEEDCQSLIDEL